MTVALTKVETQVTWRSPTAGAKTVSIPGSVPANKGYDLDISTTLGTGETYTVTPTSGTIDGAANFQFTDAKCTLSLRSDADNGDWVIRRFCCITSSSFDAVFFDGFAENIYRTTLTGVSDSPFLSFSFWIKAEQSAGIFANIINPDVPGDFGNLIDWRFHQGDLIILFNDGTNTLEAHALVPTDMAFHNVLFSADVSTAPAIVTCYVDETPQTFFISVNDGPWNIPVRGLAIGDINTGVGQQNYFGVRARSCLGDFWWAPAQFLDFSSSANRAKFHDISTLTPVPAAALGASGQVPTGVAPAVFFTGGSNTFTTNRGTGGRFLSTPTIEDCLQGLHVSLTPTRTRNGITLLGDNLQMVLATVGHLLATDSPIGMLSVWLRLRALPASGHFYEVLCGVWGNIQTIVDIALDSNGRINAIFTASDNTTHASFLQTTGGLPADNAYHHLILNWDTQAGTMQVVTDRIAHTVVRTGSVGFDVGISEEGAFRIAWAILSQRPHSLGGSFLGDAAEYWLDFYHSLDLTIPANLDKFEIAGKTIDLGVDGSAPTGATPFLYFSQQPQTYKAITFYLNRARDLAAFPDNPTQPLPALAPYP